MDTRTSNRHSPDDYPAQENDDEDNDCWVLST